MPSPFDAAISAAAATHDAIIGELFDYSPMMAEPNVRPVADTGRAIVTDLLAPFGDSADRAFSGPVRTIGVQTERPGHASNRPYISLQLSRLPYAPADGDRLLRKKTGDLYQVAERLPSTPGFMRLDLNLIKPA